MTCSRCNGTRLKLGGWMGPTPARRYPDPCSDCSPDLSPRELQAAFVLYATDPERFDAEGQARMLLEPAPEQPDKGTAKWHGVYCPTCDWRTTFVQVKDAAVATCDSCGTAAKVWNGEVQVPDAWIPRPGRTR